MYPMIDKEKTGKCLEELMQRHHMTPRDICAYLSLSCVQTVYRWIRGKNIPSVDNLYALSQLFQTKFDDMVVGSRKLVNYDIVDCHMQRLLVYRKKLCGASVP